MATTITVQGTQTEVAGTGTSVIIPVPSGAQTNDIILVSGVHQGTGSWALDAALTNIFTNAESGGLHAEQFVAYYRYPASSPVSSFTCTRGGTTAKGYVAGARILRGVEETGTIIDVTGSSLHTNVADEATGQALALAYPDTDVLLCAAALGTSVNTEINAPNAAMGSPVDVIAIAQTSGTNRWGLHVVLGDVDPAADVTTRMFPNGTNDTTPTHFTVGRLVRLLPEPPAAGNDPPVITATPTSATLKLGQATSILLSANDPEDDDVSFVLLTDPFSGGIATVVDNGNNTANLSLSTNWFNHAQVGGPSNVVVRTDDGNGNVVDKNVPVTITDTMGRVRIDGVWKPITPDAIGVPN